MRFRLLSFCGAMLLMSAILTHVTAQDKANPKKADAPKAGRVGDTDEDDYRRFFKRPTNSEEFWKAMQFEIEVGRYDLASAHLRNWLNFKPSDAELVKLADEVGIAAFLRLRNVRRWADDPKANAEAQANVDQLIKRVTDAVNQIRRDPERIRRYVGNLNASPEEYRYAMRELAKSGPYAVPYFLDALKAADADLRVRLLGALEQLGPDTIEPLAAALDNKNPQWQIDLIHLFRKRYSISTVNSILQHVVPNLWFLANSPTQAEQVRQEASAALSYFLQTPAEKLPPARVELTRQAERYYLHHVKFADPKAVTVWRWDGERVVDGWLGATTVPADRAEEYYGLRFAGQALQLDPAYQPAQIVLLSLVLDKTQEKAGLDKALERVAPSVHSLLGTVQPELINAVLERALDERHASVILGAVRDLGQRREVRATRSVTRRMPPLVRALYYPDRRVEMAAAEAMLNVPNSASSQATTRVVEVLRRAVAAEPVARQPAKVLVGFFIEDVRNAVVTAVTAAGFEAVPVSTGREIMQRLAQASDIALIFFEEELPNPGLDRLLGQLQADTFASQLPVVITASALRADPVRRFVARWPNVTVIPAPSALDGKALQPLFAARLSDKTNPSLSAAELKDYSERSIKNLARLARGEIPGYDMVPAGSSVLAALRIPSKLTPEGQISAMEVASRMKGEEAQTVLMNVIADAKRPMAVRVAAANGLVRHVQSFSPLLTRDQVRVLAEVYAQPNLEAALKSSLTPVIGSMQPSARWTGERLLQYQPPAPGAAPKADK